MSALNSYEIFLVKKYNLQPARVTGRTDYYGESDLVEADRKERAERAEKKAVQIATELKSDSEYFTSQEFRDDVMLELMEKGATLEQATNRTRDQLRLFNEARELGMM